jgi:hypothetical protein
MVSIPREVSSMTDMVDGEVARGGMGVRGKGWDEGNGEGREERDGTRVRGADLWLDHSML